MTGVSLDGVLVCRDMHESELVASLLPEHVELTRAERGCHSFRVEATDDPLIWTVAERFADAASFSAHQARVAASEWGRLTSLIERRYTVSGLGDDE